MSEVEQNSVSSGQAPVPTPASPSPSARWFHPLREMEREFERFFNRPMSLSPRDWPRWDEWFRQTELALPAMDVIDRDAEIVVRAQVPGLHVSPPRHVPERHAQHPRPGATVSGPGAGSRGASRCPLSSSMT